MKIEKLDPTELLVKYSQPHIIRLIIEKLNEVIEAVNKESKLVNPATKDRLNLFMQKRKYE